MRYTQPTIVHTSSALGSVLGMAQGKIATVEDSDSTDNRPSNGAAYEADE